MFWITGILGLVLVLSPFVVWSADQAALLWANVILGIVVLVASIVGEFSTRVPKNWLFWVNGVAGVAVFIAPLVFGKAIDIPQQWIGLGAGIGLVVVDALALYQQQSPPTAQSH